MTFEEELEVHIKANFPVLQICTYEWERLQGYCINTAKKENKKFFIWSSIKGLSKYNIDENILEEPDENTDPADILNWFASQEQSHLILLLEDFHPFLEEHTILRRIRECIRISRESQKNLIFQTLNYIAIKDLEKEVPILDLPLPKKEELQKIFDTAVANLDRDRYPGMNSSDLNEILDASLGMSSTEAEWTYRKIIAQKNRLTKAEIRDIVNAKEAIIKKSGILEYFHPESNLDSIGGLGKLKEWLRNRGSAFSKNAESFGLSTPKGVLLLGIPGCGKSLTAKTIANEWNFPLLKFDLGKVFGSLVGESESNIRRALSLAETISPSILWIDEIEKGLSGAGSSITGDSGTSTRVFGTLLTWMQEKKNKVFVIATANNIDAMPPELLRKGRFDEIFFVDLPNEDERKDIFKIHLKKKRREIKNFDLKSLSQKSIGFSGAEIEEVINEAMFLAYNDDRDLEQKDIEKALEETYPLAKTMSDTIIKLRKWAQARTKLASSPNTESIPEDKSVPKLPQERRNIFAETN